MRIVTVGHSPDADDAFMFYGLAAGGVVTPGLAFAHTLRDIQTLNEWGMEGLLDVTALSVAAYPLLAHRYALLPSGASVGDGYGPVVVARQRLAVEDLRGLRIGVPGFLTTAYLALSIRLGKGSFQPVAMPFDQIMDAVTRGDVDAGLLIHEGQLTHAAQGLEPVLELGDWWRESMGVPLPLGLNAVRLDLPRPVIAGVVRAMRDTVEFALSHRDEALGYALAFARGLDPDLAGRFVGMYVNHWTVDLGDTGRGAVELLLERGHAAGLLPAVTPRWAGEDGSAAAGATASTTPDGTQTAPGAGARPVDRASAGAALNA